MFVVVKINLENFKRIISSDTFECYKHINLYLMIFIIVVLSVLFYMINPNFKRNSLKCYCNFHVVNSIEEYFDTHTHTLYECALWDNLTVKDALKLTY